MRQGLHSKVHSWKAHILPVARLTQELVKKGGGLPREQELGFAAGLFHDWCRLPESILKKRGLTDEHEVTSAKAAAELLPQFGFSEKEVELISNAIASHSFGLHPSGGSWKVKRVSSLVGQAVKAADKLDQFAEHIIFRRNLFFGESRAPPNPENVVGYYEKRLRKARNLLKTSTGRLLLKSFPQARDALNFVSGYARVLKHEASVGKPRFRQWSERVGALAVFNFFYERGKKGVSEKQAVKEFKTFFERNLKLFSGEKRLNARERRILLGSIDYVKELLERSEVGLNEYFNG
jgi:HD superfamily phosphodiesterase